MGGTAWSDAHYSDRVKHRVATGTPTFAYSAATSSKPLHERKAHASLDPLGVKMRESRDSEAHPESRAVAVLFDVTGSMHEVPQILQKNLPKLMGLLLRKSYLAHPHILIGAIGDATCDRVPLQVGQFEAGIEIENDLTNLFLEGGGGGQQTESYELAMYFMSAHTSIDCWEKRRQRGYLFVIGDEMPYGTVKSREVKAVIGDTLQADIDTATLIKELEQRYDVYYIIPNMTSYYNDEKIHRRWVQLLGQNVLKLEQPDGICELIASTIGVCEGVALDRVSDDLKEAGTALATLDAVRGALASVRAGRNELAPAVALPDSDAASGIATL